MPTAQLLAKAFKRNVLIIEAQTKDLTHQDSLVQVPGVNCLNWVLGHLTDGRDQVLAMLGESPLMGEAGARYRRESDPITSDGPEVLPLEQLLAVLRKGQEGLTTALAARADAALEEEQQVGERTLTLLERLHFAYFHDTYHTGQTELLRALAGKIDKVI